MPYDSDGMFSNTHRYLIGFGLIMQSYDGREIYQIDSSCLDTFYDHLLKMSVSKLKYKTHVHFTLFKIL